MESNETAVAKTFYGGMGMDNERLEGDFNKEIILLKGIRNEKNTSRMSRMRSCTLQMQRFLEKWVENVKRIYLEIN